MVSKSIDILWWVLDAFAWIALGYCVARWAGPSVLPRWARLGAQPRARLLAWLDDRRSAWWAHALRVRLHRAEPGTWWTDGARMYLILEADGDAVHLTRQDGGERLLVLWPVWLRHHRCAGEDAIRNSEELLRLHANDSARAAEALDVAWSWRGPWIQMSSGRWYPLSPRPEEVCLRDLSGTVIRWSGACGDYTTHEHQIRVARLLGRRGCSALVQLEGLLHDAHEVLPPYDVPRPIKLGTAYGREARAIEALAESAMRERYCLPREMSPEVKRADAVLLATEARDLLPGGPLPGRTFAEDPLDERIVLDPSEPWRLRWVQIVATLAARCAREERDRMAASRVTDRDAWERAVVLGSLAAEARDLAKRIAPPVDQDAPTEAIDLFASAR